MNFNISLLWLKDLGRPSPGRDWIIAACVVGVLALVAIGISAYMFWSIQTGSIVAAGAAAPRAPTPVSRDSMKKVIDSYQERAANYTARNFAAFNLNDPRPVTKKK